jgi:hypothetical protein
MLWKVVFQCDDLDLLEKIHCHPLEVPLSELDTKATGMRNTPSKFLGPKRKEGVKGSLR